MGPSTYLNGGTNLHLPMGRKITAVINLLHYCRHQDHHANSHSNWGLSEDHFWGLWSQQVPQDPIQPDLIWFCLLLQLSCPLGPPAPWGTGQCAPFQARCWGAAAGVHPTHRCLCAPSAMVGETALSASLPAKHHAQHWKLQEHLHVANGSSADRVRPAPPCSLRCWRRHSGQARASTLAPSSSSPLLLLPSGAPSAPLGSRRSGPQGGRGRPSRGEATARTARPPPLTCRRWVGPCSPTL